MQKLIHKPQGDPIKPFCLERAREGYGEVVAISMTVGLGAEAFLVGDPVAGPIMVEQVVITWLQGGSLLNGYCAVYASSHRDHVIGTRGDIKLVEKGRFDAAIIRGIDANAFNDAMVLPVKKKLFFAPVFFSMYGNNQTGLGQRLQVTISVQGLQY